jgi:tRNA-2-methylthio-N6-dimethylallyladenosine synthase
MKTGKFHLETFGCQMNVLDSQLVEQQLCALGLLPTGDVSEADIILFNTCSVRQHAEDKVLSRLGQLKRLKQRRPGVVVGVLGCMAERARTALFEQVPHLDLLCGPAELHRLPDLLEAVATQRAPVQALAQSLSRRQRVEQRSAAAEPIEQLDLSRQPTPGDSVLQSYVRVQRGCDKFCTYCVVPFVRGPERSRPPDHVLVEARRLVDAGCREITLLGQTVNAYVHAENGGVVRFAELLRRVSQIEGMDRLRFVTSFPADFDEDIFRVMRDVPKVCPSLHLPIQSGSDRMLKAMKRGHSVRAYLELIDRARAFVPDIALAGDFIVGFCGETAEDFHATVELVRRVQYKSIFVFKYSPRPGTTAARGQADDVPYDVKQQRNNELLAVQEEISRADKASRVGTDVEVLVEGYSKAARRARALPEDDAPPVSAQPGRDGEDQGIHASPRQLVGRTPHDMITVFDGDAAHIGALVRIRVEASSPLTLFGRLEEVISPPRLSAG